MFPKNSLLLLILGVFLLAACGQAEGAVPTSTLEQTLPTGTASHGNEIGGYIALVDALRAAGATVEPTGTVEQPFFEVSGQTIKVDRWCRCAGL